MRVHLSYDRDGLDIGVPDAYSPTVLHMRSAPGLADPQGALCAALAQPIGTPPVSELAKGRRTACIVISDITRPVPNQLILSALLADLQEAGIDQADITILVATGIHRPATPEELAEMVGAELASQCRFVNHVARDTDSHEHLGTTARGTPVYIDKTYLSADLKVLTGLIEPHLMAGFSGGRKSVCPGITSLETVKVWHSPAFLESPKAESGTLDGNPVHEEAQEIAQMAGVDFIINAVLNEKRETVGLFAGDLVEAHLAGVARCREVVSVPISEPFDVVVTTSAGYPLDTSFYQAVKGLTGAMPAVKPGGTIILAAGMAQGVGSEEFTQLCFDMPDLDTFMHRITNEGFFVTDQWQLEEHAKAARHADIWVYSDGVDRDTLAQLFVRPIDSVEQGIDEAMQKHGPGATLAIIPEGPYVLPVLAGRD